MLTNAIDAFEQNLDWRPPNGQASKIVIETQAQIGAIVISIADNGPGMTSVVAAKIFEPVFTTKPVGKGTGLSLAISAQIVIEQHHGTLDCVTAPNKGANFIISLPLAPSHIPCKKE